MSAGLLIVLAALVTIGRLSASVFALYGLLSLAAFTAYGIDKRAARKGTWRTPEAVLHLLALLGGWPGALYAQRVFRHKTRKRRFQVTYWATVALNLAVLASIATWSNGG